MADVVLSRLWWSYPAITPLVREAPVDPPWPGLSSIASALRQKPSPMANPKVLVGPRDGRSSHHDLPGSRRSPCLVPPVVCPPSHLSPVGASSLFHPLMRRSKQSNSQRGPAKKREPSEGSSTAQDRGSVILDSRPKMSGVEPQVEIEWMIGWCLRCWVCTQLPN